MNCQLQAQGGPGRHRHRGVSREGELPGRRHLGAADADALPGAVPRHGRRRPPRRVQQLRGPPPRRRRQRQAALPTGLLAANSK